MFDLYKALTRDENDPTKDFLLLANDGTEFVVHKRLIFKKWPTLKEYFNVQTCEKEINDVDNKYKRLQTDIRADLLKIIIDYVYQIDLNVKSLSFTIIEQLLETANKFLINSLVEHILELLLTKLSIGNCLTLWKLCKRYRFKNSFKAHDFVLYNIHDKITGSLDLLFSWYRLSANEVALFLCDSYLNVRNEVDVWELAVLWINVDKGQRAQYAERFSRLLRFTSKYDAAIFFSNDKSRLLPDNFIENLNLASVQKRVPRDVIAIFGGSNREARLINISEVEVFDKRTEEWSKCRVLSGIQNTSNALAVVGQQVFALGGRGGKCLVNVLEPSPLNAVSTWHERAPMYSGRTYAAACVNSEKIYIMGGYANDDILPTVERYDPIKNQWKKMPSMLTSRSSSAAVSLNDKIYITGGTDGRVLLNSIEIFDEETNSWIEGPPLLTARKAHSAVAWGGGVLVAGGLSAIPFLSTGEDIMAQNNVEFFDPRCNKWTAMPAMDYARFHFSMVVFDDAIYAIGGQANFESPLNAVEKFDGIKWCVNSFLNNARGYHKACVLKNWPCTELILGDDVFSTRRNESIDLNDNQTVLPFV